MEIEAAHATRRKREAKLRRDKQIEEIATIAAVVLLVFLVIFLTLWLVLPKLR
jgi:hypothetical protein